MEEPKRREEGTPVVRTGFHQHLTIRVDVFLFHLIISLFYLGVRKLESELVSNRVSDHDEQSLEIPVING